MKKVAKFEKVSFDIFKEEIKKNFEINEELIFKMYSEVSTPKRATTKSAGYDFFLPFDLVLHPNETILIPTAIRVKMDDDYVLLLFPRSGLGFKYRLRLDNTIGVIDSDYYNSSNEGHIMIKLTNCNNEKTIELPKNKAFCQGVFLQYGITIDDDVTSIRDGGFGSTNK